MLLKLACLVELSGPLTLGAVRLRWRKILWSNGLRATSILVDSVCSVDSVLQEWVAQKVFWGLL